jgi:hypothetical protein
MNRYIMLDATYVDAQSRSPIAYYHPAKANADDYLPETELPYMIVCPGRLTDDQATGRISVDPNINLEGHTSRDHLPAAPAMCLDIGNRIGKTFSLLEGTAPIERALESV